MKISVVGLGYVGLPLAINFSKTNEVIGFDINTSLIEDVSLGIDRTNEIKSKNFHKNKNLKFTGDPNYLDKSDFFIITVPTPVDSSNVPDLSDVMNASKMIAPYLKKGSIVIYESTFYPGCTNSVCVPILEKYSKMTLNKDFYCGYSPERINPGDKTNSLLNTIKLVSGSTKKTAFKVDKLYSAVGIRTFKCGSIETAEAAKVIENVQRDINIALINELSIIFKRLNLDTSQVLEAAGTKWNFLPFKPGLVGGHCIGVDPYYLAQKAQELGYHPEIILAGRRLNDGMGDYVASEIVKCMIKKNIPVNGSSVLVLGITFKENCPDVRNTKAVDLIKTLKDYGTNITIHDPWADEDEVMHEYGLESLKSLPKEKFDAIVLAVAHNKFKELDFKSLKKESAIIYDIKNILSESIKDKTL